MTKKRPSPDGSAPIEAALTEPLRIIETHDSAKAHWRRARAELFRIILAPVSRISLSEWADQHRKLSRENTAEAATGERSACRISKRSWTACRIHGFAKSS
jgi:hypothetical protein